MHKGKNNLYEEVKGNLGFEAYQLPQLPAIKYHSVNDNYTWTTR
jgi:hypothetical protein